MYKTKIEKNSKLKKNASIIPHSTHFQTKYLSNPPPADALARRIRNFWSWHLSSDIEAGRLRWVCAVCTWQRTVVEGRTFFLQWIFMRWSAILNRISTCWFTQIASLAVVSFFCSYVLSIPIKHRGRRERLHPFGQSQYRSVNGLTLDIPCTSHRVTHHHTHTTHRCLIHSLKHSKPYWIYCTKQFQQPCEISN